MPPRSRPRARRCASACGTWSAASRGSASTTRATTRMGRDALITCVSLRQNRSPKPPTFASTLFSAGKQYSAGSSYGCRKFLSFRTDLPKLEIPFFFGQICLSFSDKPKSCPSRTLWRAILFDDRLQIVDYVPNKDDAGVLLAHLRCSKAVWKG